MIFKIKSYKLLNSNEVHGCVFGQNTELNSQSTNGVFRRFNWDIYHPDQDKSIQPAKSWPSCDVATSSDLQAAMNPVYSYIYHVNTAFRHVFSFQFHSSEEGRTAADEEVKVISLGLASFLTHALKDEP